MRVGIIQSNYIPWRGYFDFIDDVDCFIFLDDVRYTRRDWRNRNKVKTPDSLLWLTVPVKYNNENQLICNTEINYSSNWQSKHLKTIRSIYARAPHVNDSITILEKGLSYNDSTVSQLNMRLIKLICSYLQIDTPLLNSADCKVDGIKTELLINLLKKVGAKVYLSGPSADAYIDKEMFKENGISLEYKKYDYEPYSQLWGEFEGAVSILDLIANCGQNARRFLKSKTQNEVIVK